MGGRVNALMVVEGAVVALEVVGGTRDASVVVCAAAIRSECMVKLILA